MNGIETTQVQYSSYNSNPEHPVWGTHLPAAPASIMLTFGSKSLSDFILNWWGTCAGDASEIDSEMSAEICPYRGYDFSCCFRNVFQSYCERTLQLTDTDKYRLCSNRGRGLQSDLQSKSFAYGIVNVLKKPQLHSKIIFSISREFCVNHWMHWHIFIRYLWLGREISSHDRPSHAGQYAFVEDHGSAFITPLHDCRQQNNIGVQALSSAC